jgi:DNA-binding transcriptional LysR family regulator
MRSFSSVGEHYILPAIVEYRALHSDVTIELNLSQRMPDLCKGAIDVAIVTAAVLPTSELVAHSLREAFSVLCASPRYLQERGVPDTPNDLMHHDCLIWQTPSYSNREWI